MYQFPLFNFATGVLSHFANCFGLDFTLLRMASVSFIAALLNARCVTAINQPWRLHRTSSLPGHNNRRSMLPMMKISGQLARLVALLLVVCSSGGELSAQL
jgi:hypothetical protein